MKSKLKLEIASTAGKTAGKMDWWANTTLAFHSIVLYGVHKNEKTVRDVKSFLFPFDWKRSSVVLATNI